DADDPFHRKMLRRETRKKRFKRALLAGVLLAPIALVAWWWWTDSRATDQLEEFIAECRAAGQPIDPEDFDPPPVADEDNAALLLQDAADAIVTLEAENLFRIYNYDHGDVKDHPEEARQIVESNAKALQLARRARALTGCDWGWRMSDPILYPGLGPQRQLAKLLCFTAEYYHHVGDDRQAIETLQDALAAAGRTREIPPLIAYFTAIGQESLVMSALEEMTPTLNVAADAAGSRAATREQIQELIAALLDEEHRQRDYKLMWYGERTHLLEIG
ncbi:unnamed protein product, partial [marine sediment metagenome]